MSHSVRPSGSESLPRVEHHDAEVYEDVSTCGVTEFPVMDTIPEHTSVGSNYSPLLLINAIILCYLTMSFDFSSADMDIDVAADHTRTVIDQVASEVTAPEVVALEKDILPEPSCPAADSPPAPSSPPMVPVEKIAPTTAQESLQLPRLQSRLLFRLKML